MNSSPYVKYEALKNQSLCLAHYFIKMWSYLPSVAHGYGYSIYKCLGLI